MTELEQRNRDLESRLRRVIHAANERIADQIRGMLKSAFIEAENRRLKKEMETDRGVLEQVGEILGCIGAFTPQDVINQAGQVRRSADRMATEYHRAEVAEAELQNLRAEEPTP